MSIEAKLGIRPWRWSLRMRLFWALLSCRGNDQRMAEMADHIIRSYKIQTSDLSGATAARDRFHVLSLAADATGSIAGNALEFGVYKGITLKHIAKHIGPDRRITGFDTFEGLPEDWGDLLSKGTFATDKPMFEGYSNIDLEVGRIEETLPAYLKVNDHPISLVHIDCPYYEINVFILERVLQYLYSGSIIIFDEYYGYPSFEDHEFRAWSEIREQFDLKVKAFAYSNRSAAFLIVQNPLHQSFLTK